MNPSFLVDQLRLIDARSGYRKFINKCSESDGVFRLTAYADSSSYALCFAIFGYKLLCDYDVIDTHRVIWDRKLRSALLVHKSIRERQNFLTEDKPYLQLLTFTLSALSILGTLDRDPLLYLVTPLLPDDIEESLIGAHSLTGAARSGNQAMFLAILLIYARDYLCLDTQERIDKWVFLHRSAMNRFGFWGASRSMSHLQFQNGYHQYEIFQYLGSEDIPWGVAAASVAFLADDDGHFAPYPGGGGCYDYDAVFILTSKYQLSLRYRELLMLTADSILHEQNRDGGFCESHCIRPRSLLNFFRSISHSLSCNGCARAERLRASFNLLRKKHDRIQTHWSLYSREWNESDLWDSWFRMLTLARIDCSLNSENSNLWGFTDFPGIGFHTYVH